MYRINKLKYLLILIIVLIIILWIKLGCTKKDKVSYNDFILKKQQKMYTQGDVIIYSKPLVQNITCDIFSVYVLNSKKQIIGNGYCHIKNNEILINIDASEYRQGKYYFMVKNKIKKTLSKDCFYIRIINFDEETGLK